MSVSQSGFRVWTGWLSAWLLCLVVVEVEGLAAQPPPLPLVQQSVSQSGRQGQCVGFAPALFILAFCTFTHLNEFDRIFTLQLEATAEWRVWLDVGMCVV